MGHEVRVLAVGDPCQAIYGFAAAEFDGMEAFQQQFATNEFTLSTTFRCPRSHVDLANSIIGEMNVAMLGRKDLGEKLFQLYKDLKPSSTADLLNKLRIYCREQGTENVTIDLTATSTLCSRISV